MVGQEGLLNQAKYDYDELNTSNNELKETVAVLNTKLDAGKADVLKLQDKYSSLRKKLAEIKSDKTIVNSFSTEGTNWKVKCE